MSANIGIILINELVKHATFCLTDNPCSIHFPIKLMLPPVFGKDNMNKNYSTLSFIALFLSVYLCWFEIFWDMTKVCNWKTFELLSIQQIWNSRTDMFDGSNENLYHADEQLYTRFPFHNESETNFNLCDFVCLQGIVHFNRVRQYHFTNVTILSTLPSKCFQLGCDQP